MIKITLDDREIFAKESQTILQVCQENGIPIPTLCHDEQLTPAGVCLVCVVDVKDYGLVTSCNTRVADGIVIETGNDRVISARRKVLELMLQEHYGDCIAPCQATCPAGQDVQGYNTLIAKGLYKEALELIMETNPLPSVCGRVCIRPCESECRRNLLDQPIAIASLKRFAADYVAASGEQLDIELSPATGSRVAVIGGGPGGLSAAYYLRKMGHAVTLFDAAPKLGGTLRYGIPDYRLPQDILDRDIANIISLGIEVKTLCALDSSKQASKFSIDEHNAQTAHVLGNHCTLAGLLDNGFDAVFLATGALLGYDMRVEGEQLEGVLRGVDFLNAVAKGEPPQIGAKVAVIGGGNTAIDASRTALRLGAKEVTIVYRRSRDEMPATDWEIEEAEEEGVKIHYLAAPTKVLGDDGKVNGMVCIKMALGEPDASGRRSPVPIEGSEFVLDVDNVIAAIGQGPDVSFITEASGIKTSRDRIVADSETQLTDRPGFFAGGDAVTGAASAIAAIAAGRRAARSIDQYLHGEKVKAAEKQFNSDKGELDEIDQNDFADILREPKVKMPMLEPDIRRRNFEEIELGYSEDQARKEAERCLQCGCKAVDICKLRKLATEYGVEETITQNSFRRYLIDDSHPFIVRDPNKCISCTLCLRVCRDVQGVGRTVVYNLSDNVAAPPFSLSLLDANCESCGQCLERCPVGALTSRMALRPEHDVKTICSYCGVGCGIYLGVRGNAVVNVRGDFDNPINQSNLCVKGRFGYDFINSPERLTSPLIKREGKFVKATWDEALELIASKFVSYKGDHFAMLASARCTNEENYVMQKFARGVMGTNNIDNYASLWHAPTIAGLTTSFGSGAMTNSINEIGEANCILSIGSNTTVSHPIIGLEIKKAVRNGATLIVASPGRIDLCRFADLCIQHNPGTEVALLMGMMRVIVDEGLSDTAFIKERCENFDAFKESLKNFDIDTVSSITGVASEKIIEAARVYATNKPSSILYALDITQRAHGIDNVMAIANLAMLTGNIGKPSTGVNPLRGQNNAQGTCDMGALPDVYTGYQRVSDADIQRKFEQAWGVSLSDKPGLTLTEMFDAAIEEKVKAMYLIGENPVLSDPNSNHVRKPHQRQRLMVTEALEKLEFLVVQDLFLTETAQYADVVLPGATFAEKDGTFTNTERRVQRIRKAIEPVGDAKPDWWIVCEIAKKMNTKGFAFKHPIEIMAEIASLTPSYGGISYDRIEEPGLQWPCPTKEHPGTPMLHTAQFSRGKGQFVPLEYKPSAELPDAEGPLLLKAEHSLYHYHTGNITRKMEKVAQYSIVDL